MNKKISIFTSTVALFTLTTTARASEVINGLNITANQANITTEKQSDLPAMIGALINYAFSIIGVVFLIIILVGGYQWMVANGNEENVAKAKTRILNGIFGLMVIFFAYALVYGFLEALNISTNGV